MVAQRAGTSVLDEGCWIQEQGMTQSLKEIMLYLQLDPQHQCPSSMLGTALVVLGSARSKQQCILGLNNVCWLSYLRLLGGRPLTCSRQINKIFSLKG